MTTIHHDHRHGRSCYWDHLRCGWVCAPARPAAEPPVPEQAGLPATTPPAAEPELATAD